MATKVLIADDHAIVRTGLRALIHAEPSLELVGEATGGYEAIDLVAALRPEILVLDLSMPDLDGISVTRKLKPLYPELRILILTIHDDQALLREAIKAGASGYILKHAAETDLIEALKGVIHRDLYVDPALMRALISQEKKESRGWPAAVESLTPREIDVLKCIVEGYTNRQIAEELHISVRTVEGHRANLSDKLAMHSRAELVRYAREQNLID
ncbi:MAG TPA: response regulator transcription factor [Anaerolineales bacterium]|nr:response regulator transcription factor [Anaerolineales bacterium]